MRSSMRTITDVSVDNRAVDCSQEGLSFTINSDHISYILMEYYDIDTHAYSAWTMGDGVSSDWGRGDRINVSLSGHTAGHDYMGVYTIYQRQAGDMSEETSTGAYDVYMGAGKLQDDSATATEVYIDKDISFIKSPRYVSNNTILVGGCVLRLSDRDLLITAYNPTTGKATVAGAKINGATSTTRTTTKGENYKLITNYLTCDAFVFYYRTTPTINLTCTLTTDGIEAVGSYSQAQGTEIRSWRMWAMYYSTIYPKLTIKHDENFNLDIEDVFPPLASKGYGEFPDEPEKVYIFLEVTTQDGVTVQTSELLELSADYPLTVTMSTNPGSGIATGMPSTGRCFVFRERMGLGGSTGKYKYINDVTYGGTPQGYHLDAYENGYRETYKYIICGVDEDGYIYYGESTEFSDPRRYWAIRHLKKQSESGKFILDGGSWYTFNVDVQPAQIETVVNSNVYGTEARFPKNVQGSDRYDTGSFTALLGSISSPEANANTIEAWTEFITQGGLFILKTENGDVKIVTITGNPSRQYGTSLAELGLTRVTYTWAEVMDINEVYFA